MLYTDQELSHIITTAIATNSALQEVIKLTQANSRGKVWIIGSTLMRTLITECYGIPQETTDFDFIVEELADSLTTPAGWQLQINRYGNPKFIGNHLVDIVPLTNIYSLVSRNLPPTIDNYLKYTPITAQSLVFDLQENKLVGSAGITSLRTRTVAVHNLEALESVSKRYQTTPNGYILKKAASLGFKAIFPT